MDDRNALTTQFEQDRPRLRAVAHRMLGSYAEADDALQEAWIRLDRADTSEVDNLTAWLTTVVARVCLNMLRSRTTRREAPLDAHMPDPVVRPVDGAVGGVVGGAVGGARGAGRGADPEHEALMADSVGLALLVVLDTLPPAERLAFVLHDMFAVPFDDIAPVVGRSSEATRQLASRARRRVRGATPPSASDLARQRQVVDAFFAAADRGDFDALVAVLDPDVVLRADRGSAPGAAVLVRTAEAVAGQALMFSGPPRVVHPAVVDDGAGVVVTIDGRPVAVMAFTVVGDRIVAIEALADPDRVARLDLAGVTG